MSVVIVKLGNLLNVVRFAAKLTQYKIGVPPYNNDYIINEDFPRNKRHGSTQ